MIDIKQEKRELDEAVAKVISVTPMLTREAIKARDTTRKPADRKESLKLAIVLARALADDLELRQERLGWKDERDDVRAASFSPLKGSQKAGAVMTATPADAGFPLTVQDKALLVKALAMAASRLEAYGRSYPRTSGRHDAAALAMRDLRKRVLQASVVEQRRGSRS